MYSVCITKLEKRRSGKDRRKTDHNQNSLEKRTSNDRRTLDDRRDAIGRRLGVYLILSEKQKERLDKIINVRDVEISDLFVG
jgi:hypothetical protein